MLGVGEHLRARRPTCVVAAIADDNENLAVELSLPTYSSPFVDRVGKSLSVPRAVMSLD